MKSATQVSGAQPPAAGRWAPIVTVATVLLAAAAAAGGSVWFRMASSRRPIEFLGRAEAKRLLLAPQVTLYRCSGSSGATSPVSPDAGLSVGSAQGFTHVRRSLIQDRSYDWDAAVDAAAATWNWRLVFTDDTGKLTLDFDGQRGMMRLVERDRVVSIGPSMPALETLFTSIAKLPAGSTANQGR